MMNIQKMKAQSRKVFNQPAKKKCNEMDGITQTEHSPCSTPNKNECKFGGENLELFESSSANDQDQLEELVFPSTSKVSEKLSEVLASIRRAREKNAYQATQHLNTKRGKKAVEKVKENEKKINENRIKTQKKHKEQSSISDDFDGFNTNFLDISITPEKNGENKRPKRKKTSKYTKKSSKSKDISYVSSSEEDVFEKSSESDNICRKPNKETVLNESRSSNVTHSASTNEGSEDLSGKHLNKNINGSMADNSLEKSLTGSVIDESKKQVIVGGKTSNGNTCDENKTKLQSKKPLRCGNETLDSRFDEICAVGASKKDIGEKFDVFLKRNFEFKHVNPSKKFKHEIEESADELKTSKAASSVNLSDQLQLLSDDKIIVDNECSKKQSSTKCDTKTKSTFQATSETKVNTKTLEKLLKFSAKTHSNEPKHIVSLPTDQSSKNSIKSDDSFDISSYCDLEVSKCCTDDNEVVETEEERRVENVKSTNLKEDSQPNSIPLSNYSQTFSLIDGEENLDDIDFDL